MANAPLSASLNSGYALSVARRAGWEAGHLDFTSDFRGAAEIAAAIITEGADIVLFHWVYSWGHEEFVCTVLRLLCRECTAPLGAFGLFPTLAGGHLLKFAPQLDFILAGEFEGTLAELLLLYGERHKLKALPGVMLRNEEFVSRSLIPYLSLLPIPDDVGANRNYTTMNIAASRGCYGNCSFCFIHRYYGCNRRRVRDPVSLERELELRLKRREIESLYFIDPTFIGRGESERERAMEIGRMARRFGLPFGFEARVDSIDEGLMNSLAGSGATSVFLGIESGSETVLRRIGKRIGTEQIRRGVGAVRASGIALHLGFIMFEPDSTPVELAESYTFLDELGLLDDHELTANLLYHSQIVLHGSAAWERFGQEGRLQVDERLPFEGICRFRDKRVGRICAAMGRLTAEYFQRMGVIRLTGSGHCINGEDVNLLLKEAFCAFLGAVKHRLPHQRERLEERFLPDLLKILS